MGFYSELLFNDLEIAGSRLRELRDSALRAQELGADWAYMLDDIFVRTSDYAVIDLEIGNEIRRRLREIYRNRPTRLSKFELSKPGDDDAPEFYLDWMPERYSSKWYHVDGFVEWVAEFCLGSGQIYQLTEEEGGGLWGYIFDGRGRYRDCVFEGVGRWKKARRI